MRDGISSEIKDRNKELTLECREIWNNLHFAEIKSHALTSCIVPILLLIPTAVFIGLMSYCIYRASVSTQSYTVNIAVFSAFAAIFMCADIIAWVYIARSCSYGRPWFFVRDGRNDFQIWCASEADRVPTVRTIVNLSQHRVLYVDKNGACSIDHDSNTASEVTGFYQFIADPDKVYDSKDLSSAMRRNPKLRYKTKKVKGNKTYYRFPALSSAVFGARYARCLMSENGVLKYICVEDACRQDQGEKTSVRARKLLYDNVNIGEMQIHIPAFVRDYAAAQRFALPKASQNIIYEEITNN